MRRSLAAPISGFADLCLANCACADLWLRMRRTLESAPLLPAYGAEESSLLKTSFHRACSPDADVDEEAKLPE